MALNPLMARSTQSAASVAELDRVSVKPQVVVTKVKNLDLGATTK